MGHVRTKITIISPLNEKGEEYEILVDTGSTYTWLPRELLQRLKIEPMGKRRFRSIDGRTIEKEVGEAKVECMGESATALLVFADPGEASVLGVHTLEALALEVDPVREEIRKSEALLAYIGR